MSFWNPFSSDTKRRESVVLIDIAATEVAGAYARYAEDDLPTIIYTKRVPIEIRAGETHEHAMLHALDALGDILIREGAPALARIVGSGSADLVLVSVDAPWQETSIRAERFDADAPFIFTKSMVLKRLNETDATPSEQMLADESIIGTIVNGYETVAPYGKRAHRAAAIILTSRIDKKVAHGIVSILRGLFHTGHILPIAGGSLRYQAVRALFPHERDALVLDVNDTITSIALVRRGLFVLLSVAPGAADRAAWTSALTQSLSDVATRYPLPHAIFLLAREGDQPVLKEALATANLGRLWLSDNPPTIVPVLASQLTAFVHAAATEAPDTVLILMALYYQTRAGEDAS